ncbi:hypothetical protein [Acidithiobacillus sp.]|uniref:hypothetical protein n=1 Tax=Acidithiobacillus sp. TaxID=1872118 RepID=UPI003561AB7E
MCEKKPYCARKIDPCIIDEVEYINKNIPNVKTIASCCGHGIFPKSIICKNLKTHYIFEYYSCIGLNPKYKNGKIRKRFYKKDKNLGIYYIPEVIKYNS